VGCASALGASVAVDSFAPQAARDKTMTRAISKAMIFFMFIYFFLSFSGKAMYNKHARLSFASWVGIAPV
jgi:hypothetical protein